MGMWYGRIALYDQDDMRLALQQIEKRLAAIEAKLSVPQSSITVTDPGFTRV